MNYKVFWAPEAEERLEALLSTLEDQIQCVEAARMLDRALSVDPHEFGESRYDAVRVGFALPLGIQFEVLSDVNTVIVYVVWRIDRPGDSPNE